MRSISSIQVREPGRLTAGHIQIIASGVGDRTGTFSNAFDYARDENTVMIRDNYEHFMRLEQLIYKQKAANHEIPAAQITVNGDDVFVKLEKLKTLLDASIISQTEYESKRIELLARI